MRDPWSDLHLDVAQVNLQKMHLFLPLSPTAATKWPHKLSYKVRCSEKHTGGLRFLNNRLGGSSGKHIFPPWGHECCMQSLLLLKEAEMRKRRLIAALTSPGLSWAFQDSQFFIRSNFSFCQTKSHFSNYVEVLIVGSDLLPHIAELRSFRKLKDRNNNNEGENL